MEQAGLVPPQNLEAERAVLGAMMLNHTAMLVGMEQLRPQDFYRPDHTRIFTAIGSLFNRDSAVDLVTVCDELKRMGVLEQIGGASAVAVVCDSVAAVGNVEYYCRIVQDRALLRQMIESCSEIMGECFRGQDGAREVLSRAQGRIFELHRASGKKAFVAVKDMLSATLKIVQDFHDRKQHITGVPSGFTDLDKLTSGFQPGDLVIIAGRPSMGKTALAMNMAEHVSVDPKGPRRPVGVFSLEMSTQSLVLRLLCSHARINAHRLRTGYLREEEWRTIANKASDLDSAQIYIDDSGSSNIMEIRAKSRRLKMEHPDLAMILVDYLQLLSGLPGTENRQQEISQVSRALKALAKELELPVVALSQLSRAVESRGNAGRPMLSDLRECVVGDTLVVLADGRRVPIRSLVGTTPDVVAMGPEGKLTFAKSDKVWSVGIKPVFDVRLASGGTIRATAKHRLYGASGWVRVSELEAGDGLAIARGLPELGGAEAIQDIARKTWRKSGSDGGAFENDSATATLESGLFWDRVVEIAPAGEEEVFDLTVPGPESWLADGIVSHNSGAIEQDADSVMFVYRPAYYKNPVERTPEEMGKAEIILAKQRNGPTGSVPLTFLPDCTRFEDAAIGDEGFP